MKGKYNAPEKEAASLVPLLDLPMYSLPPANVVCEGYVFSRVCHSFCSQRGGHAWLLRGVCVVAPGGGDMRGCTGGEGGGGGIRGFIRGEACVVALGQHAWFYSGACMVLFRGHVWFYSGACIVLFRGHVWFYSGGMHGFIWGAGMRGFIWGGMCGFIQGGVHGFIWGGHAWFYLGGGVHVFFSFFGYNEIRSMSGRYASYWNAFLFLIQSLLECWVGGEIAAGSEFIHMYLLRKGMPKYSITGQTDLWRFCRENFRMHPHQNFLNFIFWKMLYKMYYPSAKQTAAVTFIPSSQLIHKSPLVRKHATACRAR